MKFEVVLLLLVLVFIVAVGLPPKVLVPPFPEFWLLTLWKKFIVLTKSSPNICCWFCFHCCSVFVLKVVVRLLHVTFVPNGAISLIFFL